MSGCVLVQEQSGNITYNLTGFKRIEIKDEAAEMRLVNPEASGLFSIRAYFGIAGDGETGVALGRYLDYKDALTYYTALILKLAEGQTFISMMPGQDRELQDRGERE